jgi:hypothetical protein
MKGRTDAFKHLPFAQVHQQESALDAIPFCFSACSTRLSWTNVAGLMLPSTTTMVMSGKR